MPDHRYGPHNPGETYVAHGFAEQQVALGEIEMNYATAGAAGSPCTVARSRPDRVVVGLRGGDAATGRALRGVRRRPARAGAEHAHARPLHPRQHRQRPRPLPRRGDRPARDRERTLFGRRARGVADRVREARSGRGGVLRGSAAVLLGSAARDRARDPPEHRPDLRPVEHLPRRPVVDRCVGRDARRRTRPLAGVDARLPDPRRAVARAEGVRPGVGPCVLDGHGRGVVRSRTDVARRQGRATCCSRITSASSTRTPAP